MRFLLDALYLFALLFASPFLLKAKSRRGLWSRFLGRTSTWRATGLVPVVLRPNPRGQAPWLAMRAPCVWFHGVSVGEIHLLRNLVQRFRERHPQARCVVSSCTDTGFVEAQKSFPDLAVIRWPLDFSWAVERSLREVRPDLVVLAEGELWPNFLLAARRQCIPVVAINVRLSPRSLSRYERCRSLARRWLALVSHFAAQTPIYAAALLRLGVDARHVSVTGNVKYDGATSDRAAPKVRALRRLLDIGDDELVWVVGSTQEPEEEIALDVYRRLQPRFPNLRLILVPRQRERFEEVAELLRRNGVPFGRRSELMTQGVALGCPTLHLRCEKPRVSPNTQGVALGYPALALRAVPLAGLRTEGAMQDSPGQRPGYSECVEWHAESVRQRLKEAVILLDTIGELSAAWGLADVAFVGGSLDGRRGGQNMIEPAAYGAAILFGPHTWNFRDTAERLLAAGAARVVHDDAELETALAQLLADSTERHRLGAAAQGLVLEQQGATERTLAILDQWLEAQPASRAPARRGLVAAGLFRREP